MLEKNYGMRRRLEERFGWAMHREYSRILLNMVDRFSVVQLLITTFSEWHWLGWKVHFVLEMTYMYWQTWVKVVTIPSDCSSMLFLPCYPSPCSPLSLSLSFSARESEYLDFVSTVTKDIVARGITTKAGLESLFAAHVSRNKHQLREVVFYTM